MAAVAQNPNNRLSDGRAVRALGVFKQAEMFSLKGRIPKHESVMNVRELDDALNVSGVWEAINLTCSWRTNSYGVYSRGFEKELDKPVGASIVWIEGAVSYTFEVPDVGHPHDKDKGLRQATGMLVFALDMLGYDEDKRVVSVIPGFDPERDVSVKDIMRPSGDALVDADGYPIRTKSKRTMLPGIFKWQEFRSSAVINSDRLKDKRFKDKATGWHGSIVRDVHGCSQINAGSSWQRITSVALVNLDGVIASEIALILRRPDNLERQP